MTSHPSRRNILAAMAAAALPLTARSVPTAPRRLLVGLPAGAALDVLSRRVTELWADRFQLDCEVENAPGGGGVLAASRALHAPADGRTLLLANSGLFSTVPVMMKDSLKFDPVAEFAPLAVMVKTPFFLVTSTDNPVRQLADLKADQGLQRKPTHFAVNTLYGANHLAGSLLFRRLGMDAQVVGYTQDSQLLLDVVSQRIPYAVLSWNNLRPLIAQGRIRALCAMTRSRAPFAPTVPALGEFGLEDCAHEGWVGIFHRRDVAPDAVQPWAQALRQILTGRPPLLDVGEYGYVSAYLDATQSAAFMRRDIARHRMLLEQLTLL